MDSDAGRVKFANCILSNLFSTIQIYIKETPICVDPHQAHLKGVVRDLINERDTPQDVLDMTRHTTLDPKRDVNEELKDTAKQVMELLDGNGIQVMCVCV